MPEEQRIGMLSVVATPIGNLEDITLRALRVLREADFVVAEDTRRTRKLLSHFDIHVRTKSLHEHSSPEDLSRIVDLLRADNHVAYVTDAGAPCVSDPGEFLVRAAVEAGFTVVPIPGPSAVITALMASGLSATQFRFVGFLPRKRSERLAQLRALVSAQDALVFYEAPHRVRAALTDMLAVFGNRPACGARELTKLHEEFLRGGVGDILNSLADTIVGEWTIVISGATEADAPVTPEEKTTWQEDLRQRLASGQSLRDAARDVAVAHNLPRRLVYQAGVGD